MRGESILYQGRLVPKAGFRAFIFGFDNQKKLVNSWIEYEDHISTGLWFSSLDSVPEKAKPKESKNDRNKRDDDNRS